MVIEAETLAEAQGIIDTLSGNSTVRVAPFVRKNGTTVPGYVRRVGSAVPTSLKAIAKAKGKKWTANPWVRSELELLWENREASPVVVKKNPVLLTRHNSKNIKRMFDKVRFNKPQSVGKKVREIIAEFHVEKVPSRFGL